MKKHYVQFFFLLFMINMICQSQKKVDSLNLDFENVQKGKISQLSNYGSDNYIFSADSVSVKKGKHSLSIEFLDGDANFKAVSFTLPENYTGNRITLTGYIKTENVTDGYAGLWMRIDPQIAFDNMDGRGATGTTDWTEYKIALPMNPEKTEKIVIGGMLVGKGKIWIDDLRVTIDRKDLKKAKIFQKLLLPADNDKEFDGGSQIATIPLEGTQQQKLRDLGLIWGFLKYYHPNIAKGQYNWDYALFRFLPKFLETNDKNESDALLVNWIAGFGNFPEGKKAKFDTSNTKLKPDLMWIENSGFSKLLIQILLKIKTASRPSEQYYIGFNDQADNPIFKNENKYEDAIYPDAGFRLLALYRYWNIIQYYFPYKNLIEEDWKNVLLEFIPKILSDQNETDYTRTIQALIGRIHDTHANIWGNNAVLNQYLGINYAPIKMEFIENQAVIVGYHDAILGKETGLKIGDVITEINEESVAEIIKKRLPQTPASNYPTQLRDIASSLLRSNDSVIDVRYRRDKIENTTILRTFSTEKIDVYSQYKIPDKSFKQLGNNIAYINNGSITTADLSKIWDKIQGTDGLIIDNRNYPSDFVLYELANYLMPKKTPFVLFTKGSLEDPGLFTYRDPYYVGEKNKNYYKGKVIILVNEITQSSSEFHAMAYRLHPNATVIGSTTAGADGNVSQFYLPGGISTMISGIGIYSPDGSETQRVGIVPDIIVKPTLEGIKKGQDEILAKAIEIIHAKSNAIKK